MKDLLANDVRKQYEQCFATLKAIVEAFPEDKWLVQHGDIYYIPSRIAYHLVVFIDRYIAGGFNDPDFASKLPFGNWMEATAETLPDKAAFFKYYDQILAKAQPVLAALDDANLISPIEPDRARMGTTQMAVHLYCMRELAAHTGELNKMLIENGLDDIWISR